MPDLRLAHVVYRTPQIGTMRDWYRCVARVGRAMSHAIGSRAEGMGTTGKEIRR